MPRVLLIILVWALQASLVVLLVNAEWVQRELQTERTWVSRQFGVQEATLIDARARERYRSWFVATGIVQGSYSRLLPDATIPQHGMEGLAPWFFRWLEHRLVAFWWLMYQAVYRLQLIRCWCGCFTVLALAAVVDGLVRRQVARIGSGYASSDRYLMARRVIAALAIAPFIYFCVPVAVAPWLVPLWGILLSAGLAVFSANIQHRL